MTANPSTFLFGGGLDVSSPALAVPPSKLISGINYEPLAEGYGRVEGFERFDGRAAPSAASFWMLPFDNGVSPIAQGNQVTGGTSGATGYVLRAPVDFAGSWDDGDGSGYLVLASVSGTFIPGEVLAVTGLTRATTVGPATQGSAATETLRRTYTGDAQAYLRAAIGKAPGAGAVRGVAMHGGTVYAWRDTVEGDAARMFRATSAGWIEITPNPVMTFTAGVSEIAEGDTILGASSGAGAMVRRVIKQAGSWGSDAAGYLVLSNVVGDFTNETVRVGSVDMATGAAATQPTFPLGGRYMAISHNFYGAADRQAMYFVNGVGTAWEMRADSLAQVRTGMPVDAPTRIFEIANHLGLCFPGGSVQFSGTGEPLQWQPLLGAGEFGLGTEITDVLQSTETAVALFGESKIAIFSGRDAESFQLDELTEEAGADAWTAQRIAKSIYLDKRGLRDLTATQAYGNFKAGTLSELIEPYFRAKRRAGRVPVMSWVSRTKSQYRLLWDDGTGLCVYMGRKAAEAIPFSTDDVRFTCVATGEMADGEGMFAGAQDGYVYRLDSGTSFDGAGVKGFVMTPFNHLGAAMVEKNLRKTTIELQAEPMTRIGVTVIFDYSDGQQPISGSQDFTVFGTGEGHDFIVQGGGGIWNSSEWNRFFWSAPFRGKAEADTEGQGVNMAVIIGCDSDPLESAHVLQAYTLHWLRRKLKR